MLENHLKQKTNKHQIQIAHICASRAKDIQFTAISDKQKQHVVRFQGLFLISMWT